MAILVSFRFSVVTGENIIIYVHTAPGGNELVCVLEVDDCMVLPGEVHHLIHNFIANFPEDRNYISC